MNVNRENKYIDSIYLFFCKPFTYKWESTDKLSETENPLNWDDCDQNIGINSQHIISSKNYVLLQTNRSFDSVWIYYFHIEHLCLHV